MNTSKTAPEIRTLRLESAAHGDAVLEHAAGLVLGDETALLDASAFEERYGGGGFSAFERDSIIGMTALDARAMVLDAFPEVV